MKNPDYEYYYIDHYYCKSVEEFIEKINKGCAMQEDSVPYKIHRINRYFDINEINIEKITYIENKTGLNLLSYKLKLKKMLNKIWIKKYYRRINLKLHIKEFKKFIIINDSS